MMVGRSFLHLRAALPPYLEDPGTRWVLRPRNLDRDDGLFYTEQSFTIDWFDDG